METSPPGRSAPLDSARALGATVIELLETRFELIGIELKEEANKRKRLLTLMVIGALFAGMALLLLAFLIVALFWETHRLAAIAAVTAAYGAVGAWALLRLRRISEDSPPAFHATLAEFRKDLDLLRGVRHD